MSRADPGAATGVVPAEPSRCGCGHLVTLHRISSRGMRAGCQAHGRTTACTCRLFVLKGATGV